MLPFPLTVSNLIKSSSGEHSHPCHCDSCLPLPILAKPRALLLVGVRVDQQRQPQLVHIIESERIQRGLALQVVIFHPVLCPS